MKKLKLALKRWLNIARVSFCGYKYNDKNLEYETRCRRCHMLRIWHFAERKDVGWREFAYAMGDYAVNPRTYRCTRCGKSTLQDLISYSEPDSH
jgi:DNA-directed RNA polymerase subunit RPC12/RpoP